MLTTSRGTLTTSRGSTAAVSVIRGASRTYHFNGSDAESIGGGRWRLRFDVAPMSIDLVNYDGALLYEGLSPGFTWEGGDFVDLELPIDAWSDDAQIHIRTTI